MKRGIRGRVSVRGRVCSTGEESKRQCARMVSTTKAEGNA